jgi:hypothetical protein
MCSWARFNCLNDGGVSSSGSRCGLRSTGSLSLFLLLFTKVSAFYPPTNAEIKNMWIYTSTPRTSSCRSAQFNKHRDKFTLPHQRSISFVRNTRMLPGQFFINNSCLQDTEKPNCVSSQRTAKLYSIKVIASATSKKQLGCG